MIEDIVRAGHPIFLYQKKNSKVFIDWEAQFYVQ